MSERRKETRYPVPEIYRNYITLRIKVDTYKFIPVSLLDFSRHGIRLKSPFYMGKDMLMECLISIPASLKREVGFRAKVRHCSEDAPDFIIGAEITEINDELWFNIFEKVHDFILDRMGKVF